LFIIEADKNALLRNVSQDKNTNKRQGWKNKSSLWLNCTVFRDLVLKLKSLNNKFL